MSMGSKANNLKIMRDNGLPVPEFEVFSFDELIPSKSEINAVIAESYGRSIKIRSAMLRQAVKRSINVSRLISIPGSYFSVRSSCGLEDSADNSFAGQFDTYLNVPREKVCAKIVDCVCSLYNENVLAYMQKKNLELYHLSMNVIVQRMVDSDVSGIVFTANPQGILNESVIVAGRGLGENVVSDRIETTSYYYSLTDEIYYYEGRENLLDDDTVRHIISVSRNITDLFGKYLDIEYAIEAGKLYILQARPITTLSFEKQVVYDNSNIVESYPGLSLPLTISFVDMVYYGVFGDAARRLLKNKKAFAKVQNVLRNTVGDTNGRLYYNINNWYSIISCLPMGRKIISVWQELIGIRNAEIGECVIKINPFIKLSVYFNALSELFHVSKNMDRLNEKFIGIREFVSSRFKEDLSATEIIELYDKIREELLSCWGITLLNDAYAFIFTGLLKSRLKKKYRNSEEIANSYISGISDIESMKPVKEMVRIAINKRNMTPEEYRKCAEEYIELYGDRALEELKLETETFRTCPELFDIKTDEFACDTENLSALLEENLEKNIGTDKTDWITSFLSKRCMRGISNREVQRLNRSRIFGMVREAMLRLGDIYVGKGYIDEKRDIFWLTLDEVRMLAENPSDKKEAVAARKEKYKMYSLLPAYSRIVFSGKPFDKSHVNVNKTAFFTGKDEIRGIPCSNGVAEGEAYVVTDVRKAFSAKDKILVTKMTDPGWVFLLAQAKGVVSEKGSLLSHTAIISRELGIPAVVGVDNLLETIQTGDKIRIDGSTGTVKIIRRKAKSA